MKYQRLFGVAFMVLLLAVGVEIGASEDSRLGQVYQQDQADRMGGVIRGRELMARDLARRMEVRALIEANQLQSPDDFFHAAMIFQHSNPGAEDYSPQQYLLAHSLASVAAFQGHRKARWLAAAALDRYLQLTGREQFFGTQQVRDEAGVWQQGEPHRLVPPVVAREFGLPSPG